MSARHLLPVVVDLLEGGALRIVAQQDGQHRAIDARLIDASQRREGTHAQALGDVTVSASVHAETTEVGRCGEELAMRVAAVKILEYRIHNVA